jgi:hypothetical protein
MPKPLKRLPGGHRNLTMAAGGLQQSTISSFKLLNLSKSSEMRNCCKFDLPDGVPTTKAMKRLKTAISTWVIRLPGMSKPWKRLPGYPRKLPMAAGAFQKATRSLSKAIRSVKIV